MNDRSRPAEPIALLIAIAVAMFGIVAFAMVRGHADGTDVLLSAGYTAIGATAVARIEQRLRERYRRR